jgi:hypothetical protein
LSDEQEAKGLKRIVANNMAGRNEFDGILVEKTEGVLVKFFQVTKGKKAQHGELRFAEKKGLPACGYKYSCLANEYITDFPLQRRANWF